MNTRIFSQEWSSSRCAPDHPPHPNDETVSSTDGYSNMSSVGSWPRSILKYHCKIEIRKNINEYKYISIDSYI